MTRPRAAATRLRQNRVMSSPRTAADVMLRRPKTLTGDVSIADVRAALADDHLHMVLLTDGSTLIGTLTRADLPELESVGAAIGWSRLQGRTVGPGEPAAEVEQMMVDQGRRRVAVVDDHDSLLGLLCLKQRGRGFCSDADIESRSRGCVDTTPAGAGAPSDVSKT